MNPMTNVKNIQKLNQRELELGSIGKKSWHDEYKDSAWVFIGGLPYDLTEGDVICVFSQYGEVVNMNLVRDKSTGKSKGFAFLCYEDQRSTVLAVDNLNSIKLLGRTIRVDHVADYKQPKEHGDEDEITKKLRAEGCAPTVQAAGVPPASSVSESQAGASDKQKKKKKIKTEKKKKKKLKIKKEKERRSASVSSNSSDSTDSSERDSSKVHGDSKSFHRNVHEGRNHSGISSQDRDRQRGGEDGGQDYSWKRDNVRKQQEGELPVKVKREKHDSGYDRAVFGHRSDIGGASSRDNQRTDQRRAGDGNSRQYDRGDSRQYDRADNRRDREKDYRTHHHHSDARNDRYRDRHEDRRSYRDRSPVSKNSHSKHH